MGHFDPVTRQELSEDQLVANLALKEVLDEFLERFAFPLSLQPHCKLVTE